MKYSVNLWICLNKRFKRSFKVGSLKDFMFVTDVEYEPGMI